jgi:hypothetical protein
LSQKKIIAALFTIAKLRKQLRCPTTDEWTKKYDIYMCMPWNISHKKNEIMSFARK